MKRNLLKRITALVLTAAVFMGIFSGTLAKSVVETQAIELIVTVGTISGSAESSSVTPADDAEYWYYYSTENEDNSTTQSYTSTFTGIIQRTVFVDDDNYYYIYYYIYNGIIYRNLNFVVVDEAGDTYLFIGSVLADSDITGITESTIYTTDAYASIDNAIAKSGDTYLYYIDTDGMVLTDYSGVSLTSDSTDSSYYLVINGVCIPDIGNALVVIDGTTYQFEDNVLTDSSGTYTVTNYDYCVYEDSDGDGVMELTLETTCSDALSDYADSSGKIAIYNDGDGTIDYTGVVDGYYVKDGIYQYQYTGNAIINGYAYYVEDGYVTLLTSQIVEADGVIYTADEDGRVDTVPADSILAEATVANVESGATVTAYKIITGVYNAYGLTDYALVDEVTGAGLSIADFEAPTGEEVNAIADAITSGTLTGLESVVMTEDDTFDGTETLYYSLDEDGSKITYNDQYVYYAVIENDEGDDEIYYLYYDNTAAGYMAVTEDEAEELGISSQYSTEKSADLTVDDIAVTTYTAYLSAGTWLILVTDIPSVTVYNPMIVSIQYTNASDVSTIYAGSVSANGAYKYDTIYAKSTSKTIDKVISDTSCAYANDYGTIENIGDAVEFTITTCIPEYSASYSSTELVFTITDLLSDGFEDVSTDDLTVLVDGSEVVAGDDTYTAETVVNDDGSQTITIAFISAYIFKHTGSTVKLVFSAILAADAATVFDDDDNTNTGTITYTNTYDTTYEQKTNPVYVYTFALTKEVQKVHDKEVFDGTEQLYYSLDEDNAPITYNTYYVLYATNSDGETYYFYCESETSDYAIITESKAAELDIETKGSKEWDTEWTVGDVVDDTTINYPLEDSTFTIYTDADCTEVYTNTVTEDGTAVTEEDGYVVFTGLETGTYYITETRSKALTDYGDGTYDAGYFINPNIYKVTITAQFNDDGTLKMYTVIVNNISDTSEGDDARSKYTITYTSDYYIITQEDAEELGISTQTNSEVSASLTAADIDIDDDAFDGTEELYYSVDTDGNYITYNDEYVYYAIGMDGEIYYFYYDTVKTVSSSVTTTMVKNSLLLILASTGGIGICFIIGLSVMVFTGVIVFTRKRKKKAAV